MHLAGKAAVRGQLKRLARAFQRQAVADDRAQINAARADQIHGLGEFGVETLAASQIEFLAHQLIQRDR